MRGFKITDGTTTVLLNFGDTRIIDYVPKAPKQDVTTVAREYDGGEQPAAFWRNVSERAVIKFSAFTGARVAMNDINRLGEKARQRQANGVGTAVYVMYRHSDSEAWYRSEVLSVQAELANDVGSQISIAFTRRYYWESDTETLLQLTNPSGGPSNSQVLRNHNAGGFYNYAQIDADDVEGDLPAPARLELYNNYNDADVVSKYWIGHRLGDYGELSHIIQFEDGTELGSTVEVTNAALSNGKYDRLNVPGSGVITKTWECTLSSALLEGAGGRWFKLLFYQAEVATATDIRMRCRVTYESLTTLWEGEWIAAPNPAFRQVVDMGNVQLPGWLVGTGGVAPLKLEVQVKKASSGAATIGFDYLMLLPMQSLRILESQGYGAAYTVTVHDNPIDNEIYSSGWTGGKLGNFVALGDPIMLVPGRDNCLYLMVDQTDNINRTTQMTVYYRPRRLVL